jgi:hypothetical protein
MLRSRALLASLVATLALGSALTAPVRAQTPSEIAAAKEWFAEGMRMEEAGDWAGALERFRRAGAVKATPQILFHQGLCEAQTGALVEAILSLSRAEHAARTANNPQVEKSAAELLADVRTRAPSLRIVAPQGALPTRVLLDGAEISSAMIGQPMPVNPGKREVMAEYPTGKFTRTVTLVERQAETVTLEAPEAAATPAAPATTPEPAPPPQPPPSTPAADTGTQSEKSSALPWVLVGAGVAATAGGVVFWMKRNAEIDDLDAICPERDACPPAKAGEVDDGKSRGTLYSAFGLGLLGVGVAGMATGGYLLLSGDSASSHAALVPAGPGGAGATVVGRF